MAQLRKQTEERLGEVKEMYQKVQEQAKAEQDQSMTHVMYMYMYVHCTEHYFSCCIILS